MSSDFTNTEHLYAEAYLLIMKYQAEGGHVLDGHVPSAEERRLKSEMRVILKEMERVMPSGTAADYVRFASLANAYHIDVFGSQINFITRLEGFKRAMTLWLKGDKSASQEDLITLLQPLQDIDYRATDQKYNQWASSVTDNWISELEMQVYPEFNSTWFKRIAILLDKNLWAYYTDKTQAVKKDLAKKYTPSLIDLSDFDTPTLQAFITLLNSATNYIGFDRAQDLNAEATQALIARPDLHPLLREAYLIGVEHTKETLAH